MVVTCGPRHYLQHCEYLGLCQICDRAHYCHIVDITHICVQGEQMTRYEMIGQLSLDDLAWFIQTIIETTEQELLESLSRHGVDADLLTLAPEVRHRKIVSDLEVEM